MGYYTELHYNVRLLPNTDKTVISILNYMMLDVKSQTDLDKLELPNHLLFKTDRWEFMLVGDSYYFNAKNHTLLKFDDIINSYYLNIICNFKNYNNEIDLFIDWIDPYVHATVDDYLGYWRNEDSEEPNIIRKK